MTASDLAISVDSFGPQLAPNTGSVSTERSLEQLTHPNPESWYDFGSAPVSDPTRSTDMRDIVDSLLANSSNMGVAKALVATIRENVKVAALREVLEIAYVTGRTKLESLLRRELDLTGENILYAQPKLLGSGATARVYAISDHLCVKVGLSRHIHHPTRGLLAEEYRIQDYLYDHGISVPRPLAHTATKRLKLPFDLPHSDSVILMERVRGEHSLLGSKATLSKRAFSLAEEELAAGSELGFEPFDTEVIFDQESDRLTLIDVGFWRGNRAAKFQVAAHSITKKIKSILGFAQLF